MATIKWKFLKDLEEGQKLAPQCTKIVEVLKSISDKEPVDRAKIVENLESSGELNTRQPVVRVVAYYQPQLVNAGLIEVIKEAAPKKPAASGKTKADEGAADPEQMKVD